MYEIYISRGFSDRDGATEFSLLQYYVTQEIIPSLL